IGLNESRKRPGQSSFLGSPRSVSAPRASNERHDWPDAPALGTAGASPSSRALRILSPSAGRPRGAGVPTPPWQRGSVGRRPLLYGEWPYGVRLTPLDPLGPGDRVGLQWCGSRTLGVVRDGQDVPTMQLGDADQRRHENTVEQFILSRLQLDQMPQNGQHVL